MSLFATDTVDKETRTIFSDIFGEKEKSSIAKFWAGFEEGCKEGCYEIKEPKEQSAMVESKDKQEFAFMQKRSAEMGDCLQKNHKQHPRDFGRGLGLFLTLISHHTSHMFIPPADKIFLTCIQRLKSVDGFKFQHVNNLVNKYLDPKKLFESGDPEYLIKEHQQKLNIFLMVLVCV